MNKVSKLDVELGRANGAIVGNFRIKMEDARDSRVRFIIAIIGLLVTLPAALGLAAGFFKQFFGIPAFYDSVQTWDMTLMKASLFIGAPLALIAGVVAITRVGFSREQDKLKSSLAVQVNPIVLLSIAVAIAVVAIFYGHLLVDDWACWRGITSAC